MNKFYLLQQFRNILYESILIGNYLKSYFLELSLQGIFGMTKVIQYVSILCTQSSIQTHLKFYFQTVGYFQIQFFKYILDNVIQRIFLN